MLKFRQHIQINAKLTYLYTIFTFYNKSEQSLSALEVDLREYSLSPYTAIYCLVLIAYY